MSALAAEAYAQAAEVTSEPSEAEMSAQAAEANAQAAVVSRHEEQALTALHDDRGNTHRALYVFL